MFKLPQYTRKDMLILGTMMPIVVVLINSLLFDKRYFTEPRVFFISSLIVLAVMTVAWFSFTWMAVTVRSRLPGDRDLIKRFGITIALIATVQALIMTFFFRGYDYFNILGYELNKTRFYWTLLIGFILNVAVTLVHEGFDSFEKWKSTLTETEQLKKAYTQSQLMGLRSQVNPHFLFNSLNSLSSLISEDEEKAETFLNELTRVYRYLLRGNEEQLVTLDTELNFIQSYFYLLHARYGEAVKLNAEVDEAQRSCLIPPLTLLTLFENAFNHNAIHKDSPLCISVRVSQHNWLELEHNIKKKTTSIPPDESGIQNLSEKIRLLTQQQIRIRTSGTQRIIQLPLIKNETADVI